MQAIQFTRSHQVPGHALYAAGEVASFRADIAAALVRRRVAEPGVVLEGRFVPDRSPAAAVETVTDRPTIEAALADTVADVTVADETAVEPARVSAPRPTGRGVRRRT